LRVTLKTTTAFYYSVIITGLIFILLMPLLVQGADGSGYFLILFIPLFLLLISTVFYLVKILTWFKEATAITVALWMFLCLFTITFFDVIFPAVLKDPTYGTLDILTAVVSLLVAFRSFKVKALPIATPFKLFGTGIALVTGPKLIIMLIGNPSMQLYGGLEDIGVVVTFLATCMVLKRTMNFLKRGEEQPAEVVGE
jgi:hypothetical protein